MSTSSWSPQGRSFARAMCIFLIIVPIVDRSIAFGQEKLAASDASQRETTSPFAQTPSAADPQRFDNLMRLIRGGGWLWTSDYTLKAHPFFLSSDRLRFATLDLARPSSASRPAFAQATARPASYQRPTAFGHLITYTALANPSTTWNGGAGNWSNGGMWSGGVPTSTTDAFIDGGKALTASPVTLDVSGAQVHNLTIDSDDSLTLPNGASLTVYGSTISNGGTISLKSTGFGAFLNISGAMTLKGTGSVIMSNDATNHIMGYGQGSGASLTNQSTIQGAGEIGWNGGLGTGNSVTNQGTINANASTPLTIGVSSGSFTNTGTLEATNGGTLMLSGGTITNTGGTIQALSGSTVQLASGMTITGGTLTTSGTGTIQANCCFNDGTLDGVTNNGTFQLTGNNIEYLAGTITNNGSLQLIASTNTTTDLDVKGAVTLKGSGTLTMSNNTGNYIMGYGQGSGSLTNQLTIRGGGNIGGPGGIGNGNSIANQGTINANASTPLTINISSADSFTNTGTLEATNGSTLVLSGSGNYTNTGGAIQALNGSTVQLTNGTIITGGTLTTSGTGTIQANCCFNDGMLNGVTNKGTFIAGDFNITYLAGTINNTGTIKLGKSSTGSARLLLKGNVTLSGNGTVTMFNAPALNVIDGNTGTEILTNFNTIQGAGIIGSDPGVSYTGGGLGLINYGKIIATQSNPLVINPNALGFNNKGTLQVNSGDLMHVSNAVGGTFANFTSRTLTGGTYNLTGALQIDQLGNTGGEIVTNAANIILNTPVSSFVDAAGKNALTNLNINALGSGFSITGGQNFTTAGNFTNNGALTIGSGSTFKIPTAFSLTNFSGTTLTGGIYNVTGTLQFPGANIVTNGANITLTGASSQIINQVGTNGLANFATNASTGNFTVAGGRTLSTSGAFINNGNLTTTGSGSEFTAGGNFINNKSLTTTGGDSEVATISSGTFTNNGTLTVGSGSKFSTGGSLSNFSGATLTGGIYNVSGMLQFPGANIVTNAANIFLIGSGSKILLQSGTLDGLRNFATNSAAGSFTISGGRNFITAGNFTNAGTFSIGPGSGFTLGGLGNFTQTAGKTTDDGTLSTSGLVTLSGGSLFGRGFITGALQSSGTVTPGDSPTSTGVLSVSKTYTQNSSGVLNISIGGTTAGTKYDQLNITGSATLKGTLNLSLIKGYVPAVGNTFDILTASTVSGTFSKVTGTSISPTEHFVVSCDPTDCDATVASGALTPAQASSFAQARTLPLNDRRSYAAAFSRNFEHSIWSRSPFSSVRVHDMATFKSALLPVHNFTDPRANSGSESTFRAIPAAKLPSGFPGRNALSLDANAAFKPVCQLTGSTPHSLFGPPLNGVARGGVYTAASAPPRNNRAVGRNRLEYGFDVLSILGMSRRHNSGGRRGLSGSTPIGYVVTNSY